MKSEKNIFDLWADNWINARKFFKSKGNVDTRARLKKKWHDEFVEMVKRLSD